MGQSIFESIKVTGIGLTCPLSVSIDPVIEVLSGKHVEMSEKSGIVSHMGCV